MYAEIIEETENDNLQQLTTRFETHKREQLSSSIGSHCTLTTLSILTKLLENRQQKTVAY